MYQHEAHANHKYCLDLLQRHQETTGSLQEKNTCVFVDGGCQRCRIRYRYSAALVAAMWNCWHTSVMHVIFLHTCQTCLWGIFWKKWCEWREEGGNECERETRRPFGIMSAIGLQWEGWLLITVCNMISRLLVPAWRVSQFVFRCQWGCGRVGHWSRVSITTHRAS